MLNKLCIKIEKVLGLNQDLHIYKVLHEIVLRTLLKTVDLD